MSKAKKVTVPVGEPFDIPADEWLMVLPDGSAVTVRSTYTPTTPGTYQVGRLTVEAVEAD